MAQLAFQRQHSYVAPALDAANMPQHKLAKNQAPTKENQDLHTAATKGDLRGLTKALDAGGNPNWYKKDEEGAAALHKAAEGGHVVCIELLLKNGSVVEDRLLTNSNSPLHLACSSGHFKAVQALVAASADINAGNSYGNAPIHGALVGGHRAVAEFLLAQGANSLWVNKKGSSLLHFVMYSPMGERGKKALANHLIEVGVDVNAQDEDGMTSLHIAARLKDEAMAAFLLENGADRNLKDVMGKTPLQWADLNTTCATSLVELLSSA